MMHPFSRALLVVTLLVGALLGAIRLFAATIVRTTDGRELVGELVGENEESLILRIGEIDTPIRRADIATVTTEASVQEEYQRRRSELADDDLEGRYQLANWLFENKALSLAQQELDDLIEAFPTDGRVAALRRVVYARIKLVEESQAAEPAQGGGGSAPTAAPAPRPAPAAQPPRPAVVRRTTRRSPDVELPEHKLTEEQINLIRVYEIDPRLQPTVRVTPDVWDRFMEAYGNEPEIPKDREVQRQLRAAPGWQKLQLMFAVRARDFYNQVEVRNDPPVIAQFRRTVYRNYVLNYCATMDCHGGYDAGNFFLYGSRSFPTRDETVYTNFYILHRYETPTGYMINRDQPERSLLLQYGLPRTMAETPHPDVPGWQPHVRTFDDARYGSVLEWLRMISPPRPDYTIEYELPRVPVSAETEEAPRPATTFPPALPTLQPPQTQEPNEGPVQGPASEPAPAQEPAPDQEQVPAQEPASTQDPASSQDPASTQEQVPAQAPASDQDQDQDQEPRGATPPAAPSTP